MKETNHSIFNNQTHILSFRVNIQRFDINRVN